MPWLKRTIPTDTGWRDISSALAGHSGGAIAIRRTGSTVWLRISDVTATDQENDYSTWSGAIPQGFRYSSSGFIYLPLGSRSTMYTPGPLRTDRYGGVLIYGAKGKRMDGFMSWPTDDPMPTTLPPEVAS